MDSAELLWFLSKWTDWDGFRAEFSAALEESVDSMRLVVDAVEHFVEMKRKGSPHKSLCTSSNGAEIVVWDTGYGNLHIFPIGSVHIQSQEVAWSLKSNIRRVGGSPYRAKYSECTPK
ncbi:hypothetical protein F0562_001364 [Nyssa sinensis]|uniref:FRIGIDA-like protein n=1 Tax=Nyssa sinensis TaxID=561372 RepID=A0A5J5C2U3_9ASTE|nr:hypothetical protein F0562_001364 [Nyssa sinensis]